MLFEASGEGAVRIRDNSSSGSFMMESLDNAASMDASSCCSGICWWSIMNAACCKDGTSEVRTGYSSSRTWYARGESLVNTLSRSSLTILRG